MNRYFNSIVVILAIMCVLPYGMFFTTDPRRMKWTRERFDKLTFVSMPEPYHNDEEYMLLKLSISSWLRTYDRARVILIVNPREFDLSGKLLADLQNDFGTDRVLYQYQWKGNMYGIPYVNSWFAGGLKIPSTDMMVFVRPGIFMGDSWFELINKLLVRFGDSVFITGSHETFQLDESLHRALEREKSFANFSFSNFVKKCRHEDGNGDLDFFVFMYNEESHIFNNLPPFLMGYGEWDTWLLGKMNKYYETISAGSADCFRLSGEKEAQKMPKFTVYNKMIKKVHDGLSADLTGVKWNVSGESVVSNRDSRVINISILQNVKPKNDAEDEESS